MIRVLIADDHPVFRRGLAGVLAEAEDIEVVGEAADGAEAVRLAEHHRPDVALMDLHMEAAGGIEATAELRDKAPDVAVLALTMATDADSVHAALRAGARGYLVKGAAGERILAAVRSVAAGDTVFGADVAAGLVQRLVQPHGRRGPFPQLTEREREVLAMMARGWDNAEIARHLFVSEKTVRNNVSNIFTKLSVGDRARAVAMARDAGLGHREGPKPTTA
jgi:DNA-binding NarL/FixJ family response regulator